MPECVDVQLSLDIRMEMFSVEFQNVFVGGSIPYMLDGNMIIPSEELLKFE